MYIYLSLYIYIHIHVYIYTHIHTYITAPPSGIQGGGMAIEDALVLGQELALCIYIHTYIHTYVTAPPLWYSGRWHGDRGRAGAGAGAGLAAPHKVLRDPARAPPVQREPRPARRCRPGIHTHIIYIYICI